MLKSRGVRVETQWMHFCSFHRRRMKRASSNSWGVKLWILQNWYHTPTQNVGPLMLEKALNCSTCILASNTFLIKVFLTGFTYWHHWSSCSAFAVLEYVLTWGIVRIGTFWKRPWIIGLEGLEWSFVQL